MKEELLTLINELKTDQEISSYDEQKTKQLIILRFLTILGWDIFSEVIPEYTVSGKRVDYALRIIDCVKAFIEVKKVKEDLDLHQEQLLNYSFHKGIKLAILTNGITWYFYLPLQEGNWEQRKFYTINIFEQEASEISLKFTDFLSRENIINGHAIKNAKKVIAGKQKQKALKETLPKAWNKLVIEQDELLIELISETSEKICGYEANENQVKDFLLTHKNQLVLSIDKPPSSSIKKQQQKPLNKKKSPDVGLKIQGSELQLNIHALKVEKQNAKALVEGFSKNSLLYYSSIFTAHKNAKSLHKNFRRIPKLLTVFKGQPKKEYPLSEIGKDLHAKDYELRKNYVAVLDKIFHIKNNIKMWEELCSNGIFDIWEPKAPYNSLNGKDDPMILLLRIFEIDYDFTIRIVPKNNYIDTIKYFDNNGIPIPISKVRIIRPIISNNSFESIIEKIKEVTFTYLEGKGEVEICNTIEMVKKLL